MASCLCRLNIGPSCIGDWDSGDRLKQTLGFQHLHYLVIGERLGRHSEILNTLLADSYCKFIDCLETFTRTWWDLGARIVEVVANKPVPKTLPVSNCIGAIPQQRTCRDQLG